ncbi:MAG: hypothetical protein ACP5LR_08535 [Athalassotoga sp.]|uniref:hypothetical protein n=1 Tax=Athalassotoga sp. TaxID=2022597 RepID=UPI003D02E487
MKIQEAIMKKNSLEAKLKTTVESFEFIPNDNDPSSGEKDFINLVSKTFGILSQYTELETGIALKNSQVKVEFNSKTMTLIELIIYMKMLKKKIDVLKQIKSKIRLSYQTQGYKNDEQAASMLYEKRKLVESVDNQIDSIIEELRNAQAVLEKTNWSENI